MPSLYRRSVNKLISHLTIGGKLEVGRSGGRKGKRGGLFEFLEVRQLFSGTPTDFTVNAPQHGAVTFTQAEFTGAYANGTLALVEFTSLPANGLLQIQGHAVTANQPYSVISLNNLTYTPIAADSGSNITFQWDGTDLTVFSGTPKNVTVAIPANAAPTLSNVTIFAAANNTTPITLGDFGLGFHDTDSGDSINNVTITSLPSHGNLTLGGANGTAVTANQTLTLQSLSNLTYTPDSTYTGTDSFTWNASDGTAFAAADATFNLSNDTAPTLSNVTFFAGANTTTAVPESDFTSGYHGSAMQQVQILTVPAHGNLTLGGANGTVAAGQILSLANLGNLSYVPNASYTLTDTFSWKASDGIFFSNAAATFTLTTDLAPTVSDVTVSALVGSSTALPAADFAAGFSDPDVGNTLQQVKIITLPTHGNLTLGGANGTPVTANQTLTTAQIATLTFVPDTSYASNDNFTWKASDGTFFSNSTATFKLINDHAPTLGPVTITLLTNISHTFSVADFLPPANGNANLGYHDADNDPLVSITIGNLPLHGNLTLSGNPVSSGQVITAANIANLTYTPTAGYSGPDFFEWNASDGLLSAAQFTDVVLNMTAPTVSNGTVSVGENHAHTITAAQFSANFTPSGIPVTNLRFVTVPSHGTLRLSDGTVITANQTVPIGDITYTPNSGYSSTDSFTWTASADGTNFAATAASVNITVNAPTDSTFSKIAGAGIVTTFAASEFAAHFSVTDGALASIRITKLPAHGVLKLGSAVVAANQVIAASNIGSLTYTPTTGYTGPDTLSWIGSDGSAVASAAANVTISVLPPLAVLGNGQIIAQNKAPMVVNFTDFANWTIGADASMEPDVRRYTIQNGTSSPMTFSRITIGGTNKNDFIVTQPSGFANGTFTVAPGATATIQVRFRPVGTGTRTAAIILKDASGKVVFQFNIQGTALVANTISTAAAGAGGIVQVGTTQNGSGPAAANGHIVLIKYTGYLADGGAIFDSSAYHADTANGFILRLDNAYGRSQPFLNNDAVKTVDGGVIPGWEFGLQGIKTGEKRTFIINAAAGYGASGQGSIPGGATLIFDVECVSVDPPPAMVVAGRNSNGSLTIISAGQKTTGSDTGTLLTIGNTTTSSSITESFYLFTLAAVTANGTPLSSWHFTNSKEPVSLQGHNRPDFSISLTSTQLGNLTLPTITVTFHPLTPGLKTEEVHIWTNDPQHPDFYFNVQGNATPYTDLAAGFDPTFNLPSTQVTTGSGQTFPVYVTISNVGNAPIPASNSTTNIQIYATPIDSSGNPTGHQTLVMYYNNVDLSGLQVNGIRRFYPQIALPLGMSAGLYTFTEVVNQSNLTANATVSPLLPSVPKVFTTLREGLSNSTLVMTDNNSVIATTFPFKTSRTKTRAISVLAGTYAVGGSLGTSTIAATKAGGATGSLTLNLQNLGNIYTNSSQIFAIDLIARAIDNSASVVLVPNYGVNAGQLGPGGTMQVTIPVTYTGSALRNTTYVLIARVTLEDKALNRLSGQQLINLDANLSPVLFHG